MNKSLRRFLLIGVVLYVGFLLWFFLGIKPGMNAKWTPADMYNEVGDCSSTTTSAPPAADQVFDAKTAVPMKSVTARRKSFRARRSASRSIMAFAKSSYSRLLNPSYSSYRFSSNGVMHMTSSAQFRSFGAEGLMYLSMPQYLKRTNNEVSAPVQVVYPYMPVPLNQQASSGEKTATDNAVVTPFYPVAQ
jgi:hypothetical protein